jgi:hypothetical protein
MHASCREEYLKWILDLSDFLQTFGTLTLPFKAPILSGYKYASKFRRLLNEYVYGMRWRENKTMLTSVMAVENFVDRPHIHFMIEEVKKMTPGAYRGLWARALNKEVSAITVKLENIRSKVAVSRYVTKNITWQQPPLISVPPRVEKFLEEKGCFVKNY